VPLGPLRSVGAFRLSLEPIGARTSPIELCHKAFLRCFCRHVIAQDNFIRLLSIKLTVYQSGPNLVRLSTGDLLDVVVRHLLFDQVDSNQLRFLPRARGLCACCNKRNTTDDGYL
jgi:hypothetical protein